MVLRVHCIPPSTGMASAQIYNSFMYALMFTCNALFYENMPTIRLWDEMKRRA